MPLLATRVHQSRNRRLVDADRGGATTQNVGVACLEPQRDHVPLGEVQGTDRRLIQELHGDVLADTDANTAGVGDDGLHTGTSPGTVAVQDRVVATERLITPHRITEGVTDVLHVVTEGERRQQGIRLEADRRDSTGSLGDTTDEVGDVGVACAVGDGLRRG